MSVCRVRFCPRPVAMILAVVVGVGVVSCTDGEAPRAGRASAPAVVPSSKAPIVPTDAALLGDWQRLQGPARRADGHQFLAPVVADGRVVVISGVDYDQATVKAIVFD